MTRRIGPRIGTAAAALGIASIAVTGLALAARQWWVAELFTHFRVQLLAGQLALLGVLLGFRQRGIALAVAVGAAVNAWYVQPVVWPEPLAAGATGARDDTLSVMTVNVSVRNDAPDTLLATLTRERPDVILVVELTQRWRSALERLADTYPYRKLAPESGPFGLGLLSRFPIERARLVELGSTRAVDARLDAPGGAFRMLGVHLMPPMSARLAAERNRQLERLAGLRADIDEPLVVLGDFNVSPYSPYYTDWVRATGLVDTIAGRGPSATWPTFLPVLGIPIDHCLVSPHFGVRGRRHLSEFGSDHYPVLVSLVRKDVE